MTRSQKGNAPEFYLGFDILPMSSPLNHAKYAAFLLSTTGVKKEYTKISRSKLIKIIHQYKVKYLGTDNPEELLKENETIANFSHLLPPTCSIVHVNLTISGKTTPLSKILTQYQHFNTNRKLNPIQTAHALVDLMMKGVGMILEPFENETMIDIGKPRRSGKGGWSQSRYERQGEEVLYRAVKEIREIFSKNNISYDEVVRETKYGAKQARFHIFISRMEINRLVNRRALYPAKIKIWSPKKKILSFRPISNNEIPKKVKYNDHLNRLIIGIDPGITTGVAIANLNGDVINIFSKKNLSKGELISELTNFGVPILVCSDVFPIPNLVKKVASTYNAELFYPKYELSHEDKKSLVKQKYSEKLNSHEMDALAAIFKAYNYYSKLFIKLGIYNFTRKELDLAKSLIIRGLSVADTSSAMVILKHQKVDKSEFIEEIKKDQDNLPGRLYNLLGEFALSEETINNLRIHSGKLEAVVNRQRKQIQKLKRVIKKIHENITKEVLKSELINTKDQQLKAMKSLISEMKKEKENMKKRLKELEDILWMSFEKDYLPVKVLDVFSHNSIHKLVKNRGVSRGEILLILDPSGGGPQTTNRLLEMDLKIIFFMGNKFPEIPDLMFRNSNVPVLPAKKYNVMFNRFYGVIKLEDLNRALLDYQIRIQKLKLIEHRMKIELEIQNYQFERKKSLNESNMNYDDFELDEEEFELTR